MRRIVADTGPLLHLAEAQALSLLPLAGAVTIPPAVDAEMARLVPDWPASRPAWIAVEHLNTSAREEALAWVQAAVLHQGEAEAIALARQIEADWFVTDDAAARLVARTAGLEVHGSLGIVLWAAASGHLRRAEAERTLERLAGSSLWISARVFAEARAALEELAEE